MFSPALTLNIIMRIMAVNNGINSEGGRKSLYKVHLIRERMATHENY